MLSAVELKEQVQAIGADLVGVTGVDSPLLREHGEEPEKLIGADEKAIKGVIYGPDFWDIWQSTVSGAFYGCFDCIAACPIGLDKSNDANRT